MPPVRTCTLRHARACPNARARTFARAGTLGPTTVTVTARVADRVTHWAWAERGPAGAAAGLGPTARKPSSFVSMSWPGSDTDRRLAGSRQYRLLLSSLGAARIYIGHFGSLRKSYVHSKKLRAREIPKFYMHIGTFSLFQRDNCEDLFTSRFDTTRSPCTVDDWVVR